jgi:hypothetical protein
VIDRFLFFAGMMALLSLGNHFSVACLWVERVWVAIPIEQELIGDDQERARAAGGVEDFDFVSVFQRNVAAVCDRRWLIGGRGMRATAPEKHFSGISQGLKETGWHIVRLAARRRL